MADTEDVAKVLFVWMFGVPYEKGKKFANSFAPFDDIIEDLEYLVLEGDIGIEKARYLLRQRKEEEKA